ncbi:hypothetical protein ACHAPQ_003752 [Fusarium lateritium]
MVSSLFNISIRLRMADNLALATTGNTITIISHIKSSDVGLFLSSSFNQTKPNQTHTIIPPHSHVDSVPLVPDPSEPLPESSSQGNKAEDPLHTIDSMRLQVIRDKDGNTLGLKVIDINNTYGKDANVSAPLPLARTNTGLVFSVKTREAAEAVYARAAHITGSERIMGIMFAPPNEPGIIRDADWSFLGTPDAKTEKEGPAETGDDSIEKTEAETQPIDISGWLKDVRLDNNSSS